MRHPLASQRAYKEIFGGLTQSPAEHLARTFDVEHDEVITLSGIGFSSMCEHHLLPFVGQAHVAYLPGESGVVGLSKLARVVDVFARRPQVQERLTTEIADAIMLHARARGALVIIEGEHYCMKMRGIRTSGTVMTTIARRGAFRDDHALCDRTLRFLSPSGS